MKKVAMTVTVTALVVLGAVSMAAAGSRDSNRDRIPDKWEKRFSLSLKVKQTGRDQDRDGLTNLGELQAGTSPRDSDSDDDGTRDGKENAGTVESFDGTTLVIALFGGGKVEGKVTPATRLKCENEGDDDDRPTATSSERGRGSSGDDDGSEDRGDDDGGDDDGADKDDADNGEDDEGSRRDGENGDRTCPAGTLKTGAVVEEAELDATSTGLVFEKVELEV